MLQLVLGRAGYGKTEYVFRSIKSLVDSGEKNIMLITPEQFSFVSERRLLSDLGESRVNLVENTSFSRLSNEISRLYGGDRLPVLTKGARAVMMKKAIQTVQDSLVLFNKNVNSISFINSVIKIYDEMKSCRVSCEDIIEASENIDKEILSLKLRDIASIIGAYDVLISGKYYDSENELTRLYEKLLNLSYFENRIVFIDGFSGFVAQEYKIIEVILKQAKKVYITFCTDSYFNSDSFDLFSYVNSNIEINKEISKKSGCPIKAPLILKENKRAENKELKAAEEFTFSNSREEYKDVPKNIKLYCARNINDECDHIALEISRLLRQGAYASDITVICRDLDKYQKELQFAFGKYNIPYFNDERQEISSQPLVMLIGFLLRTVIYSYRSEDIFSLLKTGLTRFEDDRINELENYAFVWNINGSKWKNEFTESPRGFVSEITEDDRQALISLNEIRKYIVNSIEKFRKRCKGGDVSDICRAVYFALIDFSADKKLRELAERLGADGKSALAEEQGRIWDLLMEILDKLALTGAGDQVSVREFYKLFSLMIMNEDLGSIPAGLDNVQIGSADRIRCDNPRFVFIAGANEGEFPQSVSSAGLLSESDRIALINNDFKLYSYGETLNAQEQYFAYMAVSSAKERLFVSYRGGNEKNSESSIVRGIRAVFPNIKTEYYSDNITIDKIESADNAFEILASNYNVNSELIRSLKEYFFNQVSYKSRLSAVKRLVDNDEINIKNHSLARELFKNNMYLSASRIEDYYNCAFRYFCKFGLGARPLSKAEMDPMQTGTVIHFVLEQIIKEKGSKGLAGLEDGETALLVNAHLENYLKTKMGNFEKFTPRFKYQFMRLSKMLISVVERLKEEFEQSDFEAKAFELTIGNGSEGEDVKSAVIPLDSGGSIEIKGAIDRVDIFETDGKKYVRVVDYKSGSKHFQLSDILYGLNLQMFIYLFTLAQSNSEYSGIASGVLYMHSARSILSLDRKAKQSGVKSKENSLFRMKGIVLNDEQNDIAKHMEHELKGKYIPVKYTKKDGLSGNIVSLEELGAISKKINSLIKEMGFSLHCGTISQNPVDGKYHDKTCEFCDYKYVCQNRKEIEFRKLDEFDNAEVLRMIKEENGNA